MTIGDAVSAAHANKAAMQRDDGFHRTPLQIFLLGIATLGIYQFYYVARGRRLAERRLEKKLTSYWAVLLLVVPFVNLYYYFNTLALMQSRVERAGHKPRVAFWVWGLLGVLVAASWRAPNPYSDFALLTPIFVAIVHRDVAIAERADAPSNRWPGLTWFEWLLIAIGVVLNVAVFYFMGLDDTEPQPGSMYAAWANGVIIVLGIVAFKFMTKPLRARVSK